MSSKQKQKRGCGMLANGHSAVTPGGYIRVSHRWLNSPSYKAMSCEAKVAMLDLWQHHNGRNNGQIGFSVGEVQKAVRCSRQRASQVIDELIAMRQIRCTEPAAQLGRRSRRWEISEEGTVDGNGRPKPPTYAARNMKADEVCAAVDDLKARRIAAKGDSAQRLEGLGKNKHRTPVGTDIVPPSEPQTIPNRPKSPLRTPVGTANGPLDRSLRTPVGTGLIEPSSTREAGSSKPNHISKETAEKIARGRPVDNSRVPVGFEQQRAHTLRMCDALMAAELVPPRPAIALTADQLHASAERLNIPLRLPPASSTNGHASIGVGL